MADLFITQQSLQQQQQQTQDPNKSTASRQSFAQQSHPQLQMQSVIEEEETTEKIIRDLQRNIKKQLKIINPQSPRTSQAMVNRRIQKSDLEIKTVQDIAKTLQYEINKTKFKNIQLGQQQDEDIDLEKLVFTNYLDHLEILRDQLTGIIEERRELINQHNDMLFQQTYGDGNRFYNLDHSGSRRMVKSSMGSRSVYGSVTFDSRREKLNTRQERMRKVKQNELDQDVEIEMKQKLAEEEEQLKEEEKQLKFQEIEKKRKKKFSTKKLDQKIKEIKVHQEEKQAEAFEKAQVFMSDLNSRFDSVMQKREEERFMQRQQFLSDDRTNEIKQNILNARQYQEDHRIQTQHKIIEDQHYAESRRDEHLTDTIMFNMNRNIEKQNKKEICNQIFSQRQQQKLETLLKTRESMIKQKEKQEQDLELKKKKDKKSKKLIMERYKDSSQRQQERFNQKVEKLKETLQSKENQFQKNQEDQKFVQHHRSETNLQRRLKHQNLIENHKIQQEQQIQKLQDKQQRIQDNLNKLKQEKLTLRQISLENGLKYTRESQVMSSKMIYFAKSVQSGKPKLIINNLKELGKITAKDELKYKKFFPIEKKKEEEDQNDVRY